MPTALILGASRGIGRECVRQLRDQHWKVIATARDDTALAELGKIGARAIKLDVTNPESVAGLGSQLDAERVDLALYVAGVFGPKNTAHSPPSAADFDRVMHANVFGAMLIIPVIAPLVESARGIFGVVSSSMGSIASVSSSDGWVYRASKAALNMTLKSAVSDYPKATLVALHPGWVKTDMGTEDATLPVEESVAGMLRVIAGLQPTDSGSFLSYQGSVRPW
jgi:NAD(P)-dependent dehydrogenase (short-subunit alcohol dehydrogenase family)